MLITLHKLETKYYKQKYNFFLVYHLFRLIKDMTLWKAKNKNV